VLRGTIAAIVAVLCGLVKPVDGDVFDCDFSAGSERDSMNVPVIPLAEIVPANDDCHH
jgi:hypothetical protein